MSSSRGGNVAALGTVRAAQLVSGLVIQLLVARMGLEALGLYAWITTVTTLAAVGVGLGLPVWLAREVAITPGRAPALLGSSLRVVVLLGIGSLGLLPLLLSWRAPGEDMLPIAALATVTMVGTQVARTAGGAFAGLREARLEVAGVLAGRATALVGAALAWATGGTLVMVFGAAALGAWLDATIALFRARQRLGRLEAGASFQQTARATAPYGMHLFFGMLYLSADVLVLKEFCTDAEVGTYQLAAMIALQLPVLAQVVAHASLPRFTASVGLGEPVAPLMSALLRPLVGLAWAMAIGGVLVAPALVSLVGGRPDAVTAAAPLAVLLPLLPIRFGNAMLGAAVTATGHQDRRTRAATAAAIGNLLANIALVPWLGPTGAALTTLVTEVLLGVWFASLVFRLVGDFPLLRAHLRGFVASVTMGIFVWFAAPLGLIGQLGVGVLTGLPLLVACKSLRKQDLVALGDL